MRKTLQATLLLLAAGLTGLPASAGPIARAGDLLKQEAAVPERFVSVLPSPAPRREPRYCMTIALYHEARGEPVAGQLAVARVILNRVNSRAYPDDICGVVFQNEGRRDRCQFSFACDGLSDLPRDLAAYFRLLDLTGAILNDGAADLLRPIDPREYRAANFDQITHYHTAAVAPEWGRSIHRIGQIGRHIFYRSERVARTL